MKKVYVQQLSLSDALVKCIEDNALISSDKLDSNESIHCYKGSFYYEDGAQIGASYEEALDFLESQAWTKDAIWFVVGYFSDEDLKQLGNLHHSSDRYTLGYFEKVFAEMTGTTNVRILCKAQRMDNNQWVQGQYLESIDGDGFIVTAATTKYPGSPDMAVYSVCSAHVDKCTVSRCTGKKDNRYFRIWENDIVRQYADCDGSGNSLYFFYAIKWDNDYARFYGEEIFTHETVLFDDMEDVTVVGNIIDNPKLARAESKSQLPDSFFN